jgi:hypothetical protein
VLGEKGSDEKSAEKLLVQAIRANLYCAYYIAFNDTFHQVMEYTDDVEDAEDSTLEQAIEYCNSEEMGNWLGTGGAVDWIRDMILRTSNSKEEIDEQDSDCLQIQDLEWEQKLATLEKEYEENNELGQEESVESVDEDADDDDADGVNVDLLMYTGMFRTAMDMHLDSVSTKKPI